MAVIEGKKAKRELGLFLFRISYVVCGMSCEGIGFVLDVRIL
jgi:hypothetical protein